jgi:predicted ATPase
VATAVHVYQVLGDSGVQSRLDVAGTRGLTPLVGREAEVTLLRERWAQVKDGLGQMVVLSGEAGIGKSRLVQMLKDYIANEPHTLLECRCSPYYQNTALYPVIDLLERVLHLQPEEALDAKLEKLERALSQYGLALHETVPLLATLLSLPLPEARYAPLQLTPQRQKQKTLEAILSIILELAERHPVLFIIEDVHWVDPSTMEFLHLLITQGPTAALLTVVTYRPEFQPPWGLRTHLTPLVLQRLSPAHIAAMATQVTGGKPLPTEVLQYVVTNTDGVPLFVEELTKMIVESGVLRATEARYELTGPLHTLAIPTTLHDALMARLDRLSTVKAVAQLGATIGRTFAYDLLQAVTPLDAATLQHGLRQLVAAELLYQRGVPPRATYRFKHALIQEAAYQSLVKSTRQQYHQCIAQVLEGQFPETVATHPELLAHHYTEAGLNQQSLGYWHKAGQRSAARSAHLEAIRHFTRGLEVLTTLPDTPERTQQELTLQVALGMSLLATKGWAAPDVGAAYTRAKGLCEQMSENPQLFPIMLGLWGFYIVRMELQPVRELSEQLLSLAQRQQDPVFLLEGHMTLAQALASAGEMTSARGHFEQGLALCDSQQYCSYTSLFGVDLAVFCLSMASHTLWGCGYADQALARSREALARAQELMHPFSQAVALAYAAMLHQLRREWDAAYERATAAVALCTEQEFAYYLAWGTIIQGWTLPVQGRTTEGIAQMQQGLTALQTMGAVLRRPYYLALMAGVYGDSGQTGEGLRVLAEAFAEVQKTGERFWEAELCRLKGDLLVQAMETGLHPAQMEAAEACFRQALAIARRQQAKAWELRAAVSLSRLWQHQGKTGTARQLLGEVYGGFTEGLETADLQGARALLEALG